MRFSIIVPVHNAEKYLLECLHSIDSQKEKSYEVILVVNASTDNSLLICQEWAKKHENAQVIVTDIPGVSHARNMGIEISIGEWLVFLDSDDCMRNNALTILEQGIANGYDFVISNYSSNSDMRNYSERESAIPVINYQRALLDRTQYFSKSNSGLTWNPIVLDSVWAKAYRSSIVKQFGVKFDCNISIGEDLLFNMSYSLQVKQVYCIDKDIYFYRVIPQSVSRRADVQAVEKRLQFLCALNRVQMPSELSSEKKFKIVDILLRSIIAGTEKISDINKTDVLLRKYYGKAKIVEAICECRTNSLSKSKWRNRLYQVMIVQLKEKRYRKALWSAHIYNAVAKIKPQ